MEPDEHPAAHRVVPFPAANASFGPTLLPIPRTPLIGREREVDLVATLVRNDDVPLVRWPT